MCTTVLHMDFKSISRGNWATQPAAQRDCVTIVFCNTHFLYTVSYNTHTHTQISHFLTQTSRGRKQVNRRFKDNIVKGTQSKWTCALLAPIFIPLLLLHFQHFSYKMYLIPFEAVVNGIPSLKFILHWNSSLKYSPYHGTGLFYSTWTALLLWPLSQQLLERFILGCVLALPMWLQ